MTRYAVVFSPEAVDQLEALYIDIAERASPSTALRYADAVIATCEGLSEFPHRGVARDDIRSGLRLTHHKARTVIAHAVNDATLTVAIIGIFYGGQNHETALAPKQEL